MTFSPGNNHGSFLACWCSLLLVPVCTLCRDSIQAGWDTLPLVMIISWLVADSESYQMRLLLTSVPAEVCLLSVGLCTIFSLASEFFIAPVWLIVLQDRDVQLTVFLRVNSDSREWELTQSWLFWADSLSQLSRVDSHMFSSRMTKILTKSPQKVFLDAKSLCIFQKF